MTITLSKQKYKIASSHRLGAILSLNFKKYHCYDQYAITFIPYSMRRHLIVFTLLILGQTIQSYAQQIFYGTIVDTSNNPLIGATIIDSANPSNGTMSDTDGRFSITLQNTNRIRIDFIGYSTKEVALKNETTTIRLTQDLLALDEVLVSSASRELQKRSEVPGSITSISASTIEKTKAFGIDQLVNQVPGVFMATSRAASNEQHFMAVRSPISTKALFLYLEDGLQIRPTSVFNHNALLEMNDVSYNRIEVLKGPASSIYGSEAIGGSFNFITKNPTEDLSGSIDFQTNNIGLIRTAVEVSNKTSDQFGFYIGTQYVQRNNGPVAHSDYEKFALTFKTVYDISPKTKWTSVFDIVDYRSDMSGSISERNFNEGDYQSDQTFTEREALAFRVRSTIDQYWNDQNKTSFNLMVRDNKMDQNPSYRIRQFRQAGQLTGSGSGEVNSNQFRSFVGLIQHKLDFDQINASLIIGATADYSPQKYIAETTDVIVDAETGQNTDFTINKGDFILNYKANIFNYAGFAQYEIAPIEALKITAALRYDGFEYDYDNLVEDLVGVEDAVDTFNNLTPKIGINYNFSTKTGVYANYSQGFTPPQVSTLYRNRNTVQGIKPSRYHNYELGGYYSIASRLKADLAMYLLDGANTLITLRDDDDNFFNTNAGRTRSYGIEYGITWNPIKALTIAHNGSVARHTYVDFFDRGVDLSDTERETAPNFLGTSTISYQKTFKKISGRATLEHEFVGGYNTSFENQIENENGTFETATYGGHSIFNAKATLNFQKLEIWGQVLNIFDQLYAARASYNRFRRQNSFTIGNPNTLHVGIRYTF